MTLIIKVQVLDGGKLPCKANRSDAGFDLFCVEDVVLEPGVPNKLPLNIRMELPQETYAEITTKSGLGSKGMLVYAGIIDEGYRGVPHVVCINLSKQPIHLIKGQKIAQMILHPFTTDVTIVEVESVDTNTSRGEGGFGSTGA